jgi:hypothetical protein
VAGNRVVQRQVLHWGELNNHQLKAGGLKIGGLNRQLKEKAAESRWFGPQAKRPSGGLKPPHGNQSVILFEITESLNSG